MAPAWAGYAFNWLADVTIKFRGVLSHIQTTLVTTTCLSQDSAKLRAIEHG